MLSYKNGLHIFNSVFSFRMKAICYFLCGCSRTRNFCCASLLDFLFSRRLACQFAGFHVYWNTGLLAFQNSGFQQEALFQPFFLRIWVQFLDRVFVLSPLIWQMDYLGSFFLCVFHDFRFSRRFVFTNIAYPIFICSINGIFIHDFFLCQKGRQQ